MSVFLAAQTATQILSSRCVSSIFAHPITFHTFRQESAGKIASPSSSTSQIKSALFRAQPQAISPLIFTWTPIHTAASTNVFQLGTLTTPPDTVLRPVLVLFWLITLLVFVWINVLQCLICLAGAMFVLSLVPFKHPCFLPKTIRVLACPLARIIALLTPTRADALQLAQKRNMALLMESRQCVWMFAQIRHTETNKRRPVC